jgi:hypothetical protein
MHMVTIEEVRLLKRKHPVTRLVAAWQASDLYEGSDDQRLWLAVSLDSEGKRWLPAQPIPELEKRRAQWSPVLQVRACLLSVTFWLFLSLFHYLCPGSANPRAGEAASAVESRPASEDFLAFMVTFRLFWSLVHYFGHFFTTRVQYIPDQERVFLFNSESILRLITFAHCLTFLVTFSLFGCSMFLTMSGCFSSTSNATAV